MLEPGFGGLRVLARQGRVPLWLLRPPALAPGGAADALQPSRPAALPGSRVSRGGQGPPPPRASQLRPTQTLSQRWPRPRPRPAVPARPPPPAGF